jgi:hypothetical protein
MIYGWDSSGKQSGYGFFSTESPGTIKNVRYDEDKRTHMYTLDTALGEREFREEDLDFAESGAN